MMRIAKATIATAPSDPLAHLDDLTRYAYARLGNVEDAEDVAIETVTAASRLHHRADPRLYLFGIARRKVADKLRKRGRTQSLDTEVPAPENRHRLLVDSVLAKLPDSQRDVLVLKYLHGFSSIEIGQIVRKSPAAVNSLLQRARETFAREGADLF